MNHLKIIEKMTFGLLIFMHPGVAIVKNWNQFGMKLGLK